MYRPVPSVLRPCVSAHPRTNPIAALSTLLKLLSSLSSRIGRCQYKLTPAEHALSLHLVSIIDPYVYQGAKALSTVASAQVKPTFAGIVFQPTEILDSIMAYLDSKRDLLNVALCCKHLHDVVFPRHFEYRVIRCKVSSISVWKHLLGNHSLARNVRRLEIVDERSSVAVTPRAATTAIATKQSSGGLIVPRGIVHCDTDFDSTDDELSMHKKQEKHLASALLRMSGLKEIKWSCTHSPISIEHVWPSLVMRASTLDSLEIADNLVFTPQCVGRESEEGTSGSDGETAQGDSRTVLPMSSLTSAIFCSTRHTYGASKTPELSRISSILEKCPKLKNLTISFNRQRSSQSSVLPLVDDVFNDGRWLCLTSLTLIGVRCTSSPALSQFLSEHPLLESLHLELTGIRAESLDMRPDSLPRLREIRASKEFVTAILDCQSAVPRPVEVLKGPKLSGVHAVAHGKHADEAFFHTVRRCAATMSRVELGGWHDMDDIRKLASALPGLTYLDVGRRLGSLGAREASQVVTNLEEWLDVLEKLGELRALHGVKMFYEISSINLPANAHSTSISTSNSTPSAMISTANSLGGVDLTVAAKIQSQMSLMDRSRIKKNDWTASMLVWRCPKLRRVDHWEDGTSKVVMLTRVPAGNGDDSKVRWEVRRVKSGGT
ncbi:hypothetical protein D9611_014933 [Ephemerocybe angulata]|uniref:F-box domain-containing protein n=1 Tax=Ephemerocybe angulata TaxID=980116 RepID=A0A8H5AS63_9AGAR|nr:hypothetical protein D9611_014430 [Tulosesus angulatus]KAF5328133.1 hypothetical protein D9611_014933 [Tulosesus angulatus]